MGRHFVLIGKTVYMKSKLYFLLLVPILMLASCEKWVPDVQQNIVGSWKITSVEKQTPYGSDYVNTGYENGVFYFSNNGNAQYSDNYGQMNCSWRLTAHPGESTNSMQLQLYDYYHNDAIEWEFYSVSLSGNRIIGYMNRYGYDYRYEFRRY